ncbi:MAG: site-2 protease family protein [Planctomycetia bacterium]|nr:site-2 protease family protein [Planctomycetia bacterium]
MDRESDASQPSSPLPGSGTEWVGLPAGDGTPHQIYGLPVLAELPKLEQRREPREWQPKKRWKLGIVLFLLTCASMWISASHALVILDWRGLPIPIIFFDALLESDGPVFMFAMMSVLFCHEMGHFLQSLRYRMPSSVPYFIPMPLSPIGTMGAVILMSGRNRNRKELFDIGLSGPWAGLLVAFPMLCYGTIVAKIVTPAELENAVKVTHFPDCLLVQWLNAWLRPDLGPSQELWMNPWLLAGWGATLLTGLNMLPVGQLDGGHTAYALFGKRAHWLARAAMLVAGVYIVTSRDYGWIVMYGLVLFMRPSHPPTLDDAEPLGWPRWALGFVSLFIPVICLAPMPNF